MEKQTPDNLATAGMRESVRKGEENTPSPASFFALSSLASFQPMAHNLRHLSSVRQTLASLPLKLFFWWPVMVVSGFCWLTWLWTAGANMSSFAGSLSFLSFFVAECVTLSLSFFFYVNFWNLVDRPTHSLASLQPAFDKRASVNAVVCHYFEDVSETQQTVNATLQLDRTFADVHLWILDDSFFDSPTPAALSKSDPQYCKDQVLQQKESDIDKLLSLPAADLPPLTRCAEDLIKMMFSTLRRETQHRLLQKMPAMTTEEQRKISINCEISADIVLTRDLPRPDCADASVRVEFFYRLEGQSEWRPCDVTIVGRVKPRLGHHHYKSGNINNAIYNEHMDGQFMLVLDNDMIPKKQMLNYMLPWLYRPSSTAISAWEDDEQVAFVQSPQYTVSEGSSTSETELFTLNFQKAKDSFGLCQCNGTNMLFRLDALRNIEGLPYDSFTEDTLSGLLVHRLGYRSVYVPVELALGKNPPNPAAAVLQQMRWAKGQFQTLLLYLGLQKHKPIVFRSSNDKQSFKPAPRDFMSPERLAERKLIRTVFLFHVAAHPTVSAAGLLYTIGSLIFLWSGQSPIITLGVAPVSLLLVSLLSRFMSLKTSCQLTAMEVIKGLKDHFSGCLSAVLGILDAFSEAFRGKGIPWQSTGTVKTHWTTWVVYSTVSLLISGIAFRTVEILRSSDSVHWEGLLSIALSALCVYPLWDIFIAGVTSLKKEIKIAAKSKRDPILSAVKSLEKNLHLTAST